MKVRLGAIASMDAMRVKAGVVTRWMVVGS